MSCGNMEGKDKLKKISVDVGAAEPVTVVTNAPNVSEGSLIVVALVRGEKAHTPFISRRRSS